MPDLSSKSVETESIESLDSCEGKVLICGMNLFPRNSKWPGSAEHYQFLMEPTTV